MISKKLCPRYQADLEAKWKLSELPGVACKRQLKADEQERGKEKQIQQKIDETDAEIHLKKNSEESIRVW